MGEGLSIPPTALVEPAPAASMRAESRSSESLT